MTRGFIVNVHSWWLLQCGAGKRCARWKSSAEAKSGAVKMLAERDRSAKDSTFQCKLEGKRGHQVKPHRLRLACFLQQWPRLEVGMFRVRQQAAAEELKITVNNGRWCLKWYLLLIFSPTRNMFSCGNKAGAFGLTNKGYKLNIGENYLYVIFIVGIWFPRTINKIIYWRAKKHTVDDMFVTKTIAHSHN